MTAGPALWFLHPFRFPTDHAHSVQILNTCRALAEEGAGVKLLVKRNPDRRAVGIDEALRHYGLEPHERLEIEWLPGTGNTLTGLAARWKIRRAKDRPVFYARHLRLAASAAGRGLVVVELHAIERDTAKAVAAADGIVTITSALADQVRRDFAPKSPVRVIADAADLSRFTPLATDGPPRLVYTGQFHDWKGVDVLIRALARLPSTPALIVGGRPGADPERDRLRALAESEGVAGRIEWTGFLPQAEVPGRLRAGDIGVVPTRAANGQDIAASPLKLFEHMASALPIVASDLPSLRDVIRHGENGMLFREGDPAALAGAVRELIDRPETRAAIALRAREEAPRYSWRERARRILEFVGSLQAAGHAPSPPL